MDVSSVDDVRGSTLILAAYTPGGQVNTAWEEGASPGALQVCVRGKPQTATTR